MTGCAIRPLLTIVFVILLVAGITITRCVGKDLTEMAASASQGCVRPGQGKRRSIMIKVGGYPTGSLMAGFTVRSQLTVMRVILRVAGTAGHGGALEDIIKMALFACHTDMLAS
jgi:hypothetical protein